MIFLDEDIDIRFSIGTNTRTEKKLRSKYLELAKAMNSMKMESREKTIALEKLEESFIWAVKGANEVSENPW
jgi:hypothetical protein